MDTANNEERVKRRACDECRTRKLACSKDPDGCERCIRERITCHYSEQKPMGRPRKRPHGALVAKEPPSNLDQDPLGYGSVPYIAGDFDSYNDAYTEPYLMNTISHPHVPDLLGGELEKDDPRRNIWQFGHYGPSINFSDSKIDKPSSNPPGSSFESTSQHSGSNMSSSEHNPSPEHIPVGPCSCLASMYLSLSSMQDLSSDLVTSLRTVREAARTAAECIWCPICGMVVLDRPDPPIAAFQNTMLLGTILPIIANGYQRLLSQIDVETKAAESLGQTKTFRFSDYGGFCNRQKTFMEQTLPCAMRDMFKSAVEMPAPQWRSTIRALLRVDIYGHEQGDFKHKGLKDLITDMEIRQKARHALVDAHKTAGTMEHGMFGQRLCAADHVNADGEKFHACLQMLSMAKTAVDNLIIA